MILLAGTYYPEGYKRPIRLGDPVRKLQLARVSDNIGYPEAAWLVNRSNAASDALLLMCRRIEVVSCPGTRLMHVTTVQVVIVDRESSPGYQRVQADSS